jgi:hypothetical protein
MFMRHDKNHNRKLDKDELLPFFKEVYKTAMVWRIGEKLDEGHDEKSKDKPLSKRALDSWSVDEVNEAMKKTELEKYSIGKYVNGDKFGELTEEELVETGVLQNDAI